MIVLTQITSSMKWSSLGQLYIKKKVNPGQLYRKKKKFFSEINLGQLYKKNFQKSIWDNFIKLSSPCIAIFQNL